MLHARHQLLLLLLFGALTLYVILALALGGPGGTPEPTHFLDVDG